MYGKTHHENSKVQYLHFRYLKFLVKIPAILVTLEVYGQNMIFPQPRFPWNCRGEIPSQKTAFWGEIPVVFSVANNLNQKHTAILLQGGRPNSFCTNGYMI